MNHSTEISRRKAWLIALISLLDEAALLVLIFLALRFFHVEITWPVILPICLVAVVSFVIIHRALVPAIRRRKQTGAEAMLGLTGTVTWPLCPKGVVKLNGEYWQARSNGGAINEDEEVEVVGMDGLVLEVKRKGL